MFAGGRFVGDELVLEKLAEGVDLPIEGGARLPEGSGCGGESNAKHRNHRREAVFHKKND
jgi:hypothetical protein